MKRGRVIKSTGSWYEVKTTEGEQIQCRVRGKFRHKGIRSTNPVAVGDWVAVKGDEGAYSIVDIEERKNYIVRRSVNLSKTSHIIASNLDQAVLIVTMKEPVTFPTFIDRFCVAAEAFHIPVAIVFNKIDLLTDDDIDLMESFASVYEELEYPVIFTSAEAEIGSDDLKDLLRDKVSLLSGHSGVGKSTLINKIDRNLTLRTGEISSSHQTGQHTTTFAEMFELEFGGYVVDTPGIRGFGIVDIEREELAGYFPEMRKHLPDCKFYNCLHISEPGCAVKKAIERGEIAETRYNSYLNMYHENEEQYR